MFDGVRLRQSIERANCDEVAILDGANVCDREHHEGLSLARCGDELDLQSIGFVDLHNRTQIPTAKAVLGKVSVEHNGVELLETHD